MATYNYKTVPSSLITNNSKLPLRRSNSKPSGVVSSITNKLDAETSKWKQKFEEAEEKRKTLLIQNEKTRRNLQDLEKKHTQLQVKNEEMETELFEKNESLAKLTTASKTLFKEYDTLKNQYEIETGAMNKAFSDASNWYRENKALRRRTMIMDADAVDEGVDAWESGSDSDLENLRESVKNLSAEVAYLQSELNASKLSEFEATETSVQLATELEEGKQRNEKLQQELLDLNRSHEQMLRVSNMMKRELEELKEMYNSQKNNADILRKEADDYKKERNVLAHRSTLLLQGLNTDDGMDTLLLMQEIEELKSIVEDERNKHVLEIQTLQEKIYELENNSENEVLEERLKLAESELQHTLERLEKTEEQLKSLQSKPPPPVTPPAEIIKLPPPVPPPPPPPPLLPPPVVPLRIKKLSRTSPPPEETEKDSIKPQVSGVNDEIINQIKGGFFTLRKANNEKNNNKKERETPKAVSEMLNVLGSLRKTSRKIKLRPVSNMEDIQL